LNEPEGGFEILTQGHIARNRRVHLDLPRLLQVLQQELGERQALLLGVLGVHLEQLKVNLG